MREWCIEHDERVSFFVPYIVLSVVLSLAAGLFWLFVLVSLHFALELYRHRGPAPTLVAGNALWSIRLDLVLLLVALTVTLYLDTVIGVLGLRAFPQASAAASRLPSLQRLIRSGVLMADEVARVGAYFITLRGVTGTETNVPVADTSARPWAGPWSRGTRIQLGIVVLMLVLILLAPWLTGQSVAEIAATVRSELSPFP